MSMSNKEVPHVKILPPGTAEGYDDLRRNANATYFCDTRAGVEAIDDQR